VIRAAVVWVDLSDAAPPELGKRRPAVVVSNSLQNQTLDSVVAVPLSSRAPEILPLRVRVKPTGLKASSFAVVPGIRQLKKSRILGSAGKLSPEEMARLDRAIAEYLSD
jgi:mRNA-degrading endonuclease toxin of MazEF toxin-antitoxin module